MSRICILVSLLAVCIIKVFGDKINLCECSRLIECTEQQKLTFFNDFRSKCLAPCSQKLPSSKRDSLRKCFEDHATLLELAASFNQYCVFKPENGVCVSGKSRRSLLNDLLTKRVEKRQTGSFGHYKLPIELRDFEDCIVTCENEKLKKFSDAQRQFIGGGELRPGTVDALITCTENLNCDIDVFSAFGALKACTKFSSAADVDKRMNECVVDVLRKN